MVNGNFPCFTIAQSALVFGCCFPRLDFGKWDKNVFFFVYINYIVGDPRTKYSQTCCSVLVGCHLFHKKEEIANKRDVQKINVFIFG